MARKFSDIAQLKLRIREDLRRRLEQAAKKRDVSLNYEMTSRLAESFERSEMLKLGKITAELENVYTRYAREGRDHLQTQELMRAAEYLITQLPTEVQDREAVKRAIAWAQEAIEAIARVHGRTYDHEPGEE
jgi:hypothetical protein